MGVVLVESHVQGEFASECFLRDSPDFVHGTNILVLYLLTVNKNPFAQAYT